MKTVDKQKELIWKGISASFFAGEAGGLIGQMRSNLLNCEVLRSWFIIWLSNWLRDFTNDENDSHVVENYSVSNLLKDFFETLRFILKKCDPKEIREEVFVSVPLTSQKMKEIYKKCLDTIINKLDNVLNPSSTKPVEDNQSLLQQYMKAVQEYVDNYLYEEELRNLDEIFPDVAMVKLTGMSAAGYMLQIALDMDKNLYDYSEVERSNIRFAGVLEWLLDQETNNPNLRLDKLEKQLEHFRILYCACYDLANIAAASKEHGQQEIGFGSNVKDKADKWAEAFHYLYSVYTGYSNYLIRDRIRKLISQQMLPCLSNKEADSCKELFSTPYKKYISLLEKLWDNRGNDSQQEAILGELFRLSIDTILKFQYYHPLREMNDAFRSKKPREHCPSKVCIPGSPDSAPAFLTRVAKSSDYLDTIYKAWHELNLWRKDEGVSATCGFWYRGANNAGHALLPSGFVHFAEDVGEIRRSTNVADLKDYSFLDIQRHRYESFRYAAEGTTTEVSPAVYRNTLDYLTLMQHYNQRGSHHTNMMDWTEDFFASTYFALATEIDRNDSYRYKKEKDWAKDFSEPPPDAALYILDPIHFNRACQEIEDDGMYVGTRMILSGDVPNLSILENQRRMEEYHNLYPGYAPNSQLIKPAQWLEVYRHPSTPTGTRPVTLLEIKQYAGNGKLSMHLPRAVFVAKLNNRIRAQSGMFIAYSLMSNPVVWEGEKFETQSVNDAAFRYQSLESIQEYYLNMSNKHKPFLKKIVIPSIMRSTIADLFNRLGLSREGIYPELDNNHRR